MIIPFKKYFLIGSSIFLLFTSTQTAFGIDTIADGYQVTGTEKTINAYTYCYYVKTTNGGSYFFPTKTSSEFLAFVNNKPATVNIDSCQWLTGGVHTVRDCTNAGGTVYSGYCKFNSCPSGWAGSGYYDWTGTIGTACGQRTVKCDYPSGYQFGSFCIPWGNSATFSKTAPAAGSCTYSDVNDYFGTWGEPGQSCMPMYKCTNQYVCGGFPYTCGYQNVCGMVTDCVNTTIWKSGTVCSGTAWRTCSTNNTIISASYCY